MWRCIIAGLLGDKPGTRFWIWIQSCGLVLKGFGAHTPTCSGCGGFEAVAAFCRAWLLPWPWGPKLPPPRSHSATLQTSPSGMRWWSASTKEGQGIPFLIWKWFHFTLLEKQSSFVGYLQSSLIMYYYVSISHFVSALIWNRSELDIMQLLLELSIF